MKLMLASLLLGMVTFLSACTQPLFESPEVACQNASTAVTNATLANIAAQGYLRARPNDQIAIAAADAASTALQVAVDMQASLCPKPAEEG